MTPAFGWLQILRVGLAQTALGAVVVLTTSTLNRVMAVELALSAAIPGFLVALHYAVQLARPCWGFGSDRRGRRTPWIVGGMAVLALGGVGAALATALMAESREFGIALGVLSFVAIGAGVGACGTNLLALLASHVGEGRRASAATIVWVMMIAGFVITAGTAGHFLDPFSLTRLVEVCASVSAIAFLLCCVAVWRLEPQRSCPAQPGIYDLGPERAGAEDSHGYSRKTAGMTGSSFAAAFSGVWAEPAARRFTVFVFFSMLAYSMQDLILEPFAGVAFGMTPGETTKLAGLQNGGTLTGMVLVALATRTFGEAPGGLLKSWIVAGCLASAAALGFIAFSAASADFPIRAACFALGLANGAFATAAIGSMMGLAGQGDPGTRGTRMGLWGAAQAVGFGLGGLTGALAADALRGVMGSATQGYAVVFAIDAALFLGCALFALTMGSEGARRLNPPLPSRERVRVRGRLRIERGAWAWSSAPHPEAPPHPTSASLRPPSPARGEGKGGSGLFNFSKPAVTS